MIDRRTVFEIHRLKNLNWSERRIARELRLGRNTVNKYLENPEQSISKKPERSSKLDPHHNLIDQLLEQDPLVKAPVILQRLQQHGFDGKITIVRDYLQKIRGRIKYREPFIRFESPPGKQIQIDWGHFGSLRYGDTGRKLYALAVIESYSRMIYVEFTHSQKQEALHQCLLNAFRYFGGTSEEIVVDNMLTAVTEREGSLIRFNGAFLDFLRVFKIVPVACNVRSPYEKGKIENVIKYLRQNFWPLRSFTDLRDVQAQVIEWLDTVANVRIHQTTGQRPIDRFSGVTPRELPELLPDCRETCQLLVHKDFALRFDANSYTTPPWTIGKRLTIKADQTTVTIYHRQKPVATHNRCWERKRRIEIPSHTEQVKKMKKRLWENREISLFASLGKEARDYLEYLAGARQPIKKNVSRLLSLKDEYGALSLIHAIKKAIDHKAYGADYIENILYQEMTPKNHHQPVKLKDQALNHIRLAEPSLAEYDAYILKRRHNDD
ncbi:MAG: IS21 family transposase [Deltaproteobacteria bacterium]|nr:IS21 family transposase [Deltaproteobacteria bacterium]